jgi:Sec-independent protein translocase protein TatA
VARTLGKAIAELRRQTSDIVDEFQVQAMLEDDAPRRAAPAPPSPPTAPAEPAPAKPPPDRA